MSTPKNLQAIGFALVLAVGCDGIETTGPEARSSDLAANALPAARCQNVDGTGVAIAGVGGTLTGDLTGTFAVPTDVRTDVHGPGLFVQTQFTDFDTNLGSFTTEDFFVFGPLAAPGESTSRFDGRLEIVDGPGGDDGFLHFHGIIGFTVIFVEDESVVTLRADFDYDGRVCSA